MILNQFLPIRALAKSSASCKRQINLTAALITALMVAVATFSGSAQAKANKDGYATAAEPAWVVAVKTKSSPSSPPSPLLARSSMHYELLDEQLKIDGANAEQYLHVIRVVDTVAGLGAAAQIETAFDPEYQTLTMHKLRIIRGGRLIDKLSRTKIKLLRREKELESQMYDGRVSASIVLDDVRVGDSIEYSYSIKGSNPVFKGKYLNTYWTSMVLGPTSLYQLRMLAPENRTINHRAGPEIKVASSVHGGLRETIFRREAIAQLQLDGTIPVSAYIPDQIQLSEFTDWNEVARWGERVFEPSMPAAPAVKEEAKKIRQATAVPADQVLYALNFVQKQIRYFGTEVGPYSHRPAAPGKVIEQRFGDCKDKVALLIAILRELDINAAPVLVSTEYLDDVGLLLPSAGVFNHVVARVKLGNDTYWLDGTRSHQSGPLTQRQSIGFGKGLALRAGEMDLLSMPDAANEERTQVDDHFHIHSYTEDPLLESRITFRGESAEAMRANLARSTLEQFETDVTSELARFYPGITRNGDTRIDNSETENAISIVVPFKVPNLWKFADKKRLYATATFWSPAQALRFPNDPARKYPFRIQAPGIYRHNITFDFPDNVAQGVNTFQYDDNGPIYKYHVDYRAEPRQQISKAELRLLKNQVDTASWPAYTDKVVKLYPRLSTVQIVPSVALSQVDKLSANIKDLAQAIDARKIKVSTPVQASARFGYLVSSAQLDSGRLAPKFRADVLVERGIQLDNYGQPFVAALDFEEAMRLVPDSAEIFQAAAVNAFIRGDDARTLELANKALAINSSSASLHLKKAHIYYLAGQYQQAKTELLELLKNSSEVERSYATIWLYFTARRLGEDAVETTKAYMPTASSPAWPYKVLKYFTAGGDVQGAIAEANGTQKDPSRLCELYFYLGEKYLLDGDKRQAKINFEKSVNTGVVEFDEYNMAKREMQSFERQTQ